MIKPVHRGHTESAQKVMVQTKQNIPKVAVSEKKGYHHVGIIQDRAPPACSVTDH
jgi:hypothetical protein